EQNATDDHLGEELIPSTDHVEGTDPTEHTAIVSYPQSHDSTQHLQVEIQCIKRQQNHHTERFDAYMEYNI
ncbi:hypothetical protein Pfo_010110, partial [Paulownia fortunei]